MAPATPAMTSADRRTNLPEFIVIETALALVKRKGIGRALEYMFDNSIPPDVAYRVLTDPEFQRQHYERRTLLRPVA